MARRRRAIELAMSDEEIGTLTALLRSRSERHGGLNGHGCCSPTVTIHRSSRSGGALASIIKQSSAGWSERWPMGGR